MATGRTHAKVTLYVGLPMSLALTTCSALWLGAEGPFWIPVGTLLGLLMHPDLDQPILDTSEHKILRWTFGFGSFWIGMFYGYAILFPHRSIWSHFPFLSTAIRMLWFWLQYVVRVFFVYFVVSSWSGRYESLPLFPPLLPTLYVFIGLSIPDFLHWVLDGFPMGYRDYGIFNKIATQLGSAAWIPRFFLSKTVLGRIDELNTRRG